MTSQTFLSACVERDVGIVFMRGGRRSGTEDQNAIMEQALVEVYYVAQDDFVGGERINRSVIVLVVEPALRIRSFFSKFSSLRRPMNYFSPQGTIRKFSRSRVPLDSKRVGSGTPEKAMSSTQKLIFARIYVLRAAVWKYVP
jgi:hypothetical protein